MRCACVWLEISRERFLIFDDLQQCEPVWRREPATKLPVSLPGWRPASIHAQPADATVMIHDGWHARNAASRSQVGPTRDFATFTHIEHLLSAYKRHNCIVPITSFMLVQKCTYNICFTLHCFPPLDLFDSFYKWAGYQFPHLSALSVLHSYGTCSINQTVNHVIKVFSRLL